MLIVKKIVLVLVASAFVAGSLAGCGKEETPGQKLDGAIDKAKEETKK